MATVQENRIISTVKVWLFPSLITFFSYVFYNDVKEIKKDVKALLAQSASDHADIQNLKIQVGYITNKVFVVSNPPYKPESPQCPPDGLKTEIAFLNKDEKEENKKLLSDES